MKPFFKLIRIRHWIKNGLIFLPLVFNEQLFHIALLGKAMLGFFAFSFAASVLGFVYG